MEAPAVTVDGLLGSRPETIGLPLELLSGASGLERRIASPHIQKTGLALAGFDEYLQPGRVLVFGESEVRYLDGLEQAVRINALALLEDTLAVREVIHGVLMDILGLGVLIVGESGIGKSECALDLVVRGHRLVADDTVEIRRRGETEVIGTCPELTRHHMEVRGLGVINIRDLFGVASTLASKRLELVVQLERWDANREYDRVGLDDTFHDLLGLRIPLVRMPVAPGRSLAILVEVAARNQILRTHGRHAARDLVARLERALRAGETEVEAEPDEDAEHGGHV